jgi:glycerol-3-phosphate dehydrogenase
MVAGLVEQPCTTEKLRIHGWLKQIDPDDPLHVYGSDGPAIRQLAKKNRKLGDQFDERLPITGAQVVWAADHEMARTVEDVLARRTRSLLLDARASVDIAPEVAKLLAKQLRKSTKWQKEQVADFNEVASGYILD